MCQKNMFWTASHHHWLLVSCTMNKITKVNEYMTVYQLVQQQASEWFSPLSCWKQACSIMFCFCFLFFVFLTILTILVTNYFKIYSTDLHQLFTVGRTVVVDDQSEKSRSISQWTLLWQPILVVLWIDGCRWTQVASGAAGRPNAGLSPASSFPLSALTLWDITFCRWAKLSHLQHIVYEAGSQVGNICSWFSEKYSWLYYGSAGGQSQGS